jgi:hypothetical protein
MLDELQSAQTFWHCEQQSDLLVSYKMGANLWNLGLKFLSLIILLQICI